MHSFPESFRSKEKIWRPLVPTVDIIYMPIRHCLSINIIPIIFKEGCKLFVYGVATQTPKEDLQAEFERFQRSSHEARFRSHFLQTVINL